MGVSDEAMTETTEIALPRLGETMEEARVTDWIVAEGTAFQRGDILLEVETDKTVVEVPALTDGRMVAHLVAPGDMVAIGAPIAQVQAKGAQPVPAKTGSASAASDLSAPPPPAQSSSAAAEIPSRAPRPAASPRARRLAARSGIDLATVVGSGRRGRITADDLKTGAPAGAVVADRFEPTEGEGKDAVILLHGLFAEAGAWRALPRRLAQAGHPVVVPDLPGHGRSAPVGGLDGMVAALRKVLPEGRLRLVGHSLGAILAVRLAATIPDRLARLVLIAPAGLGDRAPAGFLNAMTESRTSAALCRALGYLGPEGGPLSDRLIATELARVESERTQRRALIEEIAAGGIWQVDLAAELAAAGLAARAILGTDDRLVPWQTCRHLPDGTAIHLIGGAGHMPHLVRPDLVASLITD